MHRQSGAVREDSVKSLVAPRVSFSCLRPQARADQLVWGPVLCGLGVDEAVVKACGHTVPAVQLLAPDVVGLVAGGKPKRCRP
eukprot:CAMPEP_0204085946 /NCGR_PEP_ID=MMETSP0360-20130528/182366_1 /ASSEMBLY_ACC=CAM_ASM_000342 /TAXON_ID=268821 /ORGANISM="Scrippsiella Hangoei, Strain SHTV-5" /LENGTH=82 /DNA_ID=CAMNT_0051035025 /DNA_START=1 /DNA_END=245 /DNA_ORIENTATION=-